MPRPDEQRQDVRIFPTPDERDEIFYELVELSRESPPGELIQSYGTAHPEPNVWPDHKLVLIEAADDTGLWVRKWYAADRADQEAYNYSLSYPYGGATHYPQILRTYILPRGEDPLALGSEDPGNPYGSANSYYLQPAPSTDQYLQPSPSTDSYALPAVSATSSGAVLVGQSEEPLGLDSKISSLYVKVTRVYQVIPGSDDDVPGSGAGQADNGYTVERPLGTDTFFRLTWKLVLPRLVADNYHSPDYNACPISGYESLVLVNETIESSDENNQISNVTRVYAGNIEGAPFPSADKVRYQGKFYPNTLPPEKFVLSWRKMSDTYLTDAPEEQDVSTPSTVPVAAPSNKYDGMVSVEAKPKNVLEGEKETTWYTDIEIATLRGENWDDSLRDYVPFTTFVIPSAEYENLGEPASGTQRDVTPLGTGWTMVTVQAPRETTIEILTSPFTDLGGSARSYLDSIPDQWPQVLKRMTPILSDSGTISLDYEFDPAEYSGPCIACFQVAWSKTPPMIATNPTLAAEAFNTTSLRIMWPGVLNVQIPACLHRNTETISGVDAGTYVFTGPLGTNFYKAWPPTVYGDWPESYVKEVSVKPYLGGYRLEKITVHRPNVT
jgi:hypothetical protein